MFTIDSILRTLLLAATAVSLQAASVVIANPSFEVDNPGGVDGPGSFGPTVTDWTGVGPVAWFQPATAVFPSVPDGFNVGAAGFGGTASLSQTLAATVQPNTIYTLTFWVGQRNDVPLSSWLVSLSANNVILASDGSLVPAPGTFVEDTISFYSGLSPAQLDQPLVIGLFDTGSPGTAQVDFDNLSLDASTPEPATGGVLAVGLGALVFFFRRRRERGSISF
jgi:hypothetical protein